MGFWRRIAMMVLAPFVVLPGIFLLLVAGLVAGVFMAVCWVIDRYWIRPRLVRRFRSAGRVITSAECLARWNRGEGTVLRETKIDGEEMWWTPDQVEMLGVDLLTEFPAKDRAHAERMVVACDRTIELRRTYLDPHTGTGLWVHDVSSGRTAWREILAGPRERVVPLCMWADRPMRWWEFMERGFCRKCGYSLSELPENAVCPECGTKPVVGPPGRDAKERAPEA